jgi:hypothetical protein
MSERYITVSQGIGGWFAVLVWMNPDMGGFWEPYDTGIGRYATKAEAETEARMWAKDESLEFKP